MAALGNAPLGKERLGQLVSSSVARMEGRDDVDLDAGVLSQRVDQPLNTLLRTSIQDLREVVHPSIGLRKRRIREYHSLNQATQDEHAKPSCAHGPSTSQHVRHVLNLIASNPAWQ